MQLKNTSCCGIGDCEIGTSTPLNFLLELLKRSKRPSNFYPTVSKKAFYLLSDSVKSGKASAVIKLVTDNKLGDFAKIPNKKNPNSSRIIEAYLYSPDWTALEKWSKDAQKKAEIEELKNKIKEAELKLKKLTATSKPDNKK